MATESLRWGDASKGRGVNKGSQGGWICSFLVGKCSLSQSRAVSESRRLPLGSISVSGAYVLKESQGLLFCGNRGSIADESAFVDDQFVPAGFSKRKIG